MNKLELLELISNQYPKLLNFAGFRMQIYTAILTQLKKDKTK